MKISQLQYISPQYTDNTYFSHIQEIIDAGIKWVQIRVKDIDEETWLDIATKAVEMCHRQKVICIINDNPEIALKSGADGVHLGKNDMLPSQARTIIGKNKIIGGTANTIDDIRTLVSEGVDYIGLGPFRFTTTKKNLSPILGIDGYKAIMHQCKNEHISTPIVAIGGITHDDITGICETGIYGIAVSGFIAQSSDKKKVVESIQKTMQNVL